MYWDRALIGRSGPDMLVSGNRSQLFILGGIFIGPQYDITDNRNYHLLMLSAYFSSAETALTTSIHIVCVPWQKMAIKKLLLFKIDRESKPDAFQRLSRK